LSCNYTVASRASRFAFPETRFGLWPGMGATSLVGRRASVAYAANVIANGTTLSASEALGEGLIDRVVIRDTEKTVLSALTRSGRLGEMRLTELARMRRRHARYSHDEAMMVVAIWVDAVLSAPERTLNHIDRIVKAQVSRLSRMPTKEH
jgi:DSF synthase